MKRFLLGFFTLFIFTSADVEVSDVVYKSEVTFNDQTFVLNGAGIREKFFLDLYTVGLYLKTKSSSAEVILNSEESKLLRIVVVSGLITSDRFNKGMDEGFKKSSNGEEHLYLDQIELLKNGFGSDFNINDEFFIHFELDGKVSIYKGSKLRMVIPSNISFQKILLGVWLGKEPAGNELKENLLGID
jgi:hypothetical protein